MKNCKTCNAALEDTAIFCVMCGAKMEGVTENNFATPPASSNVDYAAAMTNESNNPSPRQVFFNATSSGKALVSVILLTITFLISLASAVISVFSMANGSFASDLIAAMQGTGSIDNALAQTFAQGMVVSMNVMVLAMLAPLALTLLGVIFTYVNSKKRSFSTKGLTMLMVSNIITLAYYAAMAFLLVIASLGIPYGFIAVIIGCAIGLALPVFIQIAFITTINKLKRVVSQDQNLTIPTFVPVIVIIGCGISALIGLTSGDILSMLIGGISVVGNVFFAICLFDYNNALALMRVKNMYDKPADRGNGL